MAFMDYFQYVVIVFLVCMSGLFSGLTLGLLGQDLNGLEIIRGSSDLQNKMYAEK